MPDGPCIPSLPVRLCAVQKYGANPRAVAGVADVRVREDAAEVNLAQFHVVLQAHATTRTTRTTRIRRTRQSLTDDADGADDDSDDSDDSDETDDADEADDSDDSDKADETDGVSLRSRRLNLFISPSHPSSGRFPNQRHILASLLSIKGRYCALGKFCLCLSASVSVSHPLPYSHIPNPQPPSIDNND